MATQTRLPLKHPDALEINSELGFVEQGTQATYFACGVPLFIHDTSDAPARRLAAMQILELRLAGKNELSESFGINRVTLYRQQLLFRAGGVAAMVGKKRGPKGAHKLTETFLCRAQDALDGGGSQQDAARSAGVSVKTIQRALEPR